MTRQFSYNENVAAWQPTIQKVRDDLGLSATHYSDATMLALIHVESSGDPEAHRTGSAFWGLLQAANPYVYDACDYAGVPRTKARELDGDGEAALQISLWYFERYASRHDYQPTKIAALHKGGAGTAGTIDGLMRKGVPMIKAIEEAERVRGVPNLVKYVHEFRRALSVWGPWVDDQETAKACLMNREPKV